MRYNALTRRYFESAPHAGAMPGSDLMSREGVFRGAAGNRDHGTWVQFDVRVAAQRIADARFLAFGCPHIIAVAAWIAEQAQGSELRAALAEPVAALARRFEVPAEKLGRLLVVEDAWLAAAKSALSPPAPAPSLSLKEL